jgi:hypothetical protein
VVKRRRSISGYRVDAEGSDSRGASVASLTVSMGNQGAVRGRLLSAGRHLISECSPDAAWEVAGLIPGRLRNY